MVHALDIKLSGGRRVSDIVMAPLLARAVEPVVVDVGARNGMHQTVIPNSFAAHAKIIGFEPNPEEYEKLIVNDTDAERIGAPMTRFKREQYYPYALWDNEEKRPFYITAGAGACTLMGEADPHLCKKMWLEGADRTYAEQHTDVRKTTPVECRRLDQILPHDHVIDILKIDVEGGELSVLKGTQGLLQQKSVLFIKSEFLLTPYYQQCPVLGHQQVMLHDQGFRLIGMDFDHAPYSRSKTAIPASADRRLVYGGDAYFILDPDRNTLDPLILHRLGVASLVCQFYSLAISLFEDAGFIANQDVREIERAISRNWTLKRIRCIWGQIPKRVKDIFR